MNIENPIVKSGDELHINIENLYKPEKSSNPVYIFKQYDFDIDKEGNFLIKYTNEDFKVGHINEQDVFVLEPPLVMRGPFIIVNPGERGDERHNFFKYPVEIKPGNIVKTPKTNTGVFKTPGLPTTKKSANLTPMFTDTDVLYTMDQTKSYIQHADNIDVETKTPAHLNKLNNLGLYVIYQMNTQNMYTQYEFVKAVFTDPKKKTEGYFVFKKSEPIRKRQLKELPELVEELEYVPEENPKSAFGKKYREAKARFEKDHTFLQGDKYKKVINELKRKTRKSKSKSKSKTQSTSKSRPSSKEPQP